MEVFTKHIKHFLTKNSKKLTQENKNKKQLMLYLAIAKVLRRGFKVKKKKEKMINMIKMDFLLFKSLTSNK